MTQRISKIVTRAFKIFVEKFPYLKIKEKKLLILSQTHITCWEHFLDPKLTISGYGTVIGHQRELSSARRELQGQTAFAIMTKFLLQLHDILTILVSFVCYNQGMVKGCSLPCYACLRHHCRSNIDLYIEQQRISSSVTNGFRVMKIGANSGTHMMN